MDKCPSHSLEHSTSGQPDTAAARKIIATASAHALTEHKYSESVLNMTIFGQVAGKQLDPLMVERQIIRCHAGSRVFLEGLQVKKAHKQAANSSEGTNSFSAKACRLHWGMMTIPSGTLALALFMLIQASHFL